MTDDKVFDLRDLFGWWGRHKPWLFLEPVIGVLGATYNFITYDPSWTVTGELLLRSPLAQLERIEPRLLMAFPSQAPVTTHLPPNWKELARDAYWIEFQESSRGIGLGRYLEIRVMTREMLEAQAEALKPWADALVEAGVPPVAVEYGEFVTDLGVNVGLDNPKFAVTTVIYIGVATGLVLLFGMGLGVATKEWNA
jgi:hypothetical protein